MHMTTRGLFQTVHYVENSGYVNPELGEILGFSMITDSEVNLLSSRLTVK